jgi:diguanylate cyclase (GGDEF)-like protein
MRKLKRERIRLSFKIIVTIAALVGCALVALIDQATAGELAFSIFYVFIIAAVGWFGGSAAGGVTAVFAAVLWTMYSRPEDYVYAHPLLPYLSVVMRFGGLLLVAYSLAKLKNRFELEEDLIRRDSLTGVLNNLGFFDSACKELARARRYERPLTVVSIGCDNFKRINEKYGYQEGDVLLKIVAESLSCVARGSDTVARFGGDEFILLLPETDFDGAGHMLTRLERHLTLAMKDNDWPVTFSIGAVTFISAPGTVDDVLRQSDILMLKIKKSGKNAVRHELFSERTTAVQT